MKDLDERLLEEVVDVGVAPEHAVQGGVDAAAFAAKELALRGRVPRDATPREIEVVSPDARCPGALGHALIVALHPEKVTSPSRKSSP